MGGDYSASSSTAQSSATGATKFGAVNIVTGVGGGSMNSIGMMLAAAAAIWFFFFRKKSA